MHARGQTGMELLLVIAFVLVVSLGVVLPYVESQNITNAAYVAKLSILPFIEKNDLRAKINSVIPEIVGSDLTIHITTSGNWGTEVLDDLQSFGGCDNLCLEVKSVWSSGVVAIDWKNNSGTSTSDICSLIC